MENLKFNRYLGLFLFIGFLLLIIGFLFDYGLIFSASLRNIIHLAVYALVSVYIFDIFLNLFLFIKSGKIKNFSRVYIAFYIATGIILIQYILLKLDVYNNIFMNKNHTFYFILLTQFYVLYIFFSKFYRIINLIILNSKQNKLLSTHSKLILTVTVLFILIFLIFLKRLGPIALVLPLTMKEKGFNIRYREKKSIMIG